MFLAILPEIWFTSAPQWLLLVIIVIAVAVLIKGADWLVEGIVTIAERSGLSKAIIAATVVALGTTSPEAAVSVLAAVKGNAGLALGNGVGSVIVDSGLVFGLGCLLTRLPADRFLLSRQGWVQTGAPVLLAIFCYVAYALEGPEAVLTRPLGGVLLFLLLAYVAISVRWSRQHPHHELDAEVDEAASARKSIAVAGVLGLIGLVLVIVAADGMVQSASELALHWGLPETVIAGTIVAFGTSLPELVVGMTSLRKGHVEVLVGSVIGADILNILFVIGASAVASPLHLIDDGNAIFLYLHLPVMLAIILLFRLFIFMAIRRGHFSRWMGVPLLTVFVAYIVLQYVATTMFAV